MTWYHAEPMSEWTTKTPTVEGVYACMYGDNGPFLRLRLPDATGGPTQWWYIGPMPEAPQPGPPPLGWYWVTIDGSEPVVRHISETGIVTSDLRLPMVGWRNYKFGNKIAAPEFHGAGE